MLPVTNATDLNIPMARSKQKKSFGITIPHETKASISAVVLFGISALLVLAKLEKAGPAGRIILKILEGLFGWGYYLVPVIAIAIGVMFLVSHGKKLLTLTFAGGGAAILFLLGLIDILFPTHGGLVGNAIGSIEFAFGKVAAIIIVAMLAMIALLIAFNASLIFKPSWLTDKKRDEKEMEDEDLMVTGDSATAEAEEKPEEEVAEEPEEEKELDVRESSPTPTTRIKAISIKDYVAPPLSLLKSTTEKPTSGDLRANANIIKRTLESFGIPVEMGEINIGPKVTRYTLKPAEGVKLARILALNQDLALALAAHPIRIEAPIPGKSLVGIEVPNKSAAIVRLGSLMNYKEFTEKGPLVFPLGRDVSGDPIFVDIERLPHMLVAGSTGSGKSITIHSILTSLLFKNAPATLKLILIDPKRVELSAYEGIPHLAAPVITDAKKSVGVFRWAIAEMDRRYETLLKAGCRDIKGYNKDREELLPYIVIVVDEMADLMSRYGREIEGSIVRLAQMARATGIHLILSTQRPSVEVVTGLIKANITARIALQVASQIDSRTILDIAGAEKLLGGGDLLFISSEYSKPKRVQSAYLSEEELKGVTDFIREKNEVVEEPVEEVAGEEDTRGLRPNGDIFDGFEEGDEDDLFQEAVEVVKSSGKASASLLQRRLKVGYARAARLIDIMEERGIVGPGEGAKPREILIDGSE
ncbi:MAG: DNA translocase FtsK [Patescibacteria group bacterium]